MDFSSFKNSEIFLLSLKVGEGFDGVSVTKRTDKRIYLSTGQIVHIKESGKFKYLDAKGNTIKQILRDIEGFLLMRIHIHFEYQ